MRIRWSKGICRDYLPDGVLTERASSSTRPLCKWTRRRHPERAALLMLSESATEVSRALSTLAGATLEQRHAERRRTGLVLAHGRRRGARALAPPRPLGRPHHHDRGLRKRGEMLRELRRTHQDCFSRGVVLLMRPAAVKARLSTRWTSVRSVVDSCRIQGGTCMTLLARASHRKTARRFLAAVLGLGAVLASLDERRPGSTGRHQSLAGRLLDARRRLQGDHRRLSRRPPRARTSPSRQSYAASGPQAAAVHNGLPGRRRQPLARPRRLGALAGRPRQHDVEQGHATAAW